MYELLNASFQDVRRLFVLAYVIAAGADIKNTHKSDIKNKKYFLPRGDISNYNALIDDQSINDLIKQHDEVKRVSTGQNVDYTTGCLLDHTYFKDNYRLIAVDLIKQKAIDADPRAM